MPRVRSKQVKVAYTRTVLQRREITVSVPPQVDDVTARMVAEQIANAKLTGTGWELVPGSGATKASK